MKTETSPDKVYGLCETANNIEQTDQYLHDGFDYGKYEFEDAVNMAGLRQSSMVDMHNLEKLKTERPYEQIQSHIYKNENIEKTRSRMSQNTTAMTTKQSRRTSMSKPIGNINSRKPPIQSNIHIKTTSIGSYSTTNKSRVNKSQAETQRLNKKQQNNDSFQSSNVVLDYESVPPVDLQKQRTINETTSRLGNREKLNSHILQNTSNKIMTPTSRFHDIQKLSGFTQGPRLPIKTAQIDMVPPSQNSNDSTPTTLSTPQNQTKNSNTTRTKSYSVNNSCKPEIWNAKQILATQQASQTPKNQQNPQQKQLQPIQKPQVSTANKLESFRTLIDNKKAQNPDSQPFELKDFTLGIQIGAGAFALVKRAVHKESSLTLAIKTYDKKSLSDKHAQDALHSEIKILSQLEHPNIMTLYEVIDTRTNVNLIMELCQGKSLYHYIKKKSGLKIDEQECKKIFKQVVEAVAYLHQNNVCHRDLKLDNILVDEQKNIKLIDFGFSVECNKDQKLSLFCGTPHYMDPDIAKKRDYLGQPSDVWSLGVILFILSTGKLPFFGEFEADLFRKIQKAKYEIPRECVMSVELKALLKRIFNVDSLTRVTAQHILNDDWFKASSQTAIKAN
eukprot:403351578